MLRDSFWIDWVWTDQFKDELARGYLYPRWLPLANGGTGSPTFYFYPPLAFYVSGLLGLLGLSTYAAVIGCFAIGLVASGYAMLAWLRGTKHALIGTLLFMTAPYHALDFYGRGAQGEFLGIALIPLIALGLRSAEKQRPVMLAFAYAALILTHLPLALLTSLFLIVPYCLWQREVRPYALPLAVGLALSAIYLVPALALNDYRRTDLLWGPQFQPENWSLFFPHDGPVPGMRKAFAAILLEAIVPIAVLWFARQKQMAGYAAVCCAIAAGIVPAIWTLPILREVQFPFRMMPLIEFAIATGVASSNLSGSRILLLAFPQLTLTPVFVFVHPHENVPSIAQLAAFHPDVAENHLARPGPLPEWPERVGLLVSLLGLSVSAAMRLASRERDRVEPNVAAADG
jgi:uncharacterized membrane protein